MADETTLAAPTLDDLRNAVYTAVDAMVRGFYPVPELYHGEKLVATGLDALVQQMNAFSSGMAKYAAEGEWAFSYSYLNEMYKVLSRASGEHRAQKYLARIRHACNQLGVITDWRHKDYADWRSQIYVSINQLFNSHPAFSVMSHNPGPGLNLRAVPEYAALIDVIEPLFEQIKELAAAGQQA